MSERMRIIARGIGPVYTDVRTEDEASVIGSYWNAVRRFVRTGDASDLGDFEGVRIGEYELETDPGEIEYWAAAGELEFEDIYEGV